jgi:hypothetical protein
MERRRSVSPQTFLGMPFFYPLAADSIDLRTKAMQNGSRMLFIYSIDPIAAGKTPMVGINDDRFLEATPEISSVSPKTPLPESGRNRVLRGERSPSIKKPLQSGRKVRRIRMSESAYKIIELVGSSAASWGEAAKNAVEEAGETLKNLRIAEINKLDMRVEDGKVIAYRAWVTVSFKYEGTLIMQAVPFPCSKRFSMKSKIF